MEYNLDGMAPLPKSNILKRAWQRLTLPHYGRTIGFLTLLVIALSVPATIAFLGNRTNLQQKAAGGQNGEIKFSTDKAGNNLITTTNNPELYLQITRPEGWEITTQGTIIKSSPIASLINKAYAAVSCTPPAVCSTKTGVPDDQWTKTGDTCVLTDSEGTEEEGACYIRNTGGGSNPTSTPTPVSSAGGATGRCGLVQVQQRSVSLGANVPVRIVYGGNPTKVKFWISSDSEIGKNPTEVSSWSPIGDQSLTSSDAVYQVSTNGFSSGQHAVLAQLLNNSGDVLDENRSNCTDTFTLGSGGSNPTATPTQTAGGSIFPANGAGITGNTVQLRWTPSRPALYHIRVNNEGNQTALAANVSREPNCPNNLFVCASTPNTWLDIPLPNIGTYVWWVTEGDNPITIAQGNFTVSGSSGGTTPTQVTLNQIAIQNIDNGSGGLSLQRISGKTALVNFFTDPYWKLNTTGGATRTVRVDFYGTDAQGNPVQKKTDATIIYTGASAPPPPAATPTRTPFGCEVKPSVMGSHQGSTPVSDDLYRWVQVNKISAGGQPLISCNDDRLNESVCGGETPAETLAMGNSQCPQNISQHPNVIKETSNWCRRTPGGDEGVAHCWQLRYIPPAPTAQPTPAGQATPTATGIPPLPTGTGTPPAACQTTYTISGKVTKQDGQPIDQASICLDPSADGTTCTTNLTGITNALGNYEVIVPQGEVNNAGHNVYALKKDITTGTTKGKITDSTPVILAQSQLCKNNTGVNLAVTFTAPGAEPTATPVPTATPSITPPPPGPASVTFKVTLAGIGIKTNKGSQSIVNDKPNQRKRDATLYLYAPDVDATGDFEGAKAVKKIPQPKAIEYDGNGKFVASDFNLSDKFTSGQYQIFVWTPGYLRKRIPGTQTLKLGTNTINQVVTLTLGDADNNNHLDTLDFRAYRSCLNLQTTDCLKADFNDDGYIDNDDKHNGKEGNNKPSFLDYNLFISQFAIIDGD